jgi:hypothetical protein
LQNTTTRHFEYCSPNSALLFTISAAFVMTDTKPHFLHGIVQSMERATEHTAKKAKIEKPKFPPYREVLFYSFQEIIALLKEKAYTPSFNVDNIEIEVSSYFLFVLFFFF